MNDAKKSPMDPIYVDFQRVRQTVQSVFRLDSLSSQLKLTSGQMGQGIRASCSGQSALGIFVCSKVNSSSGH